MGHWERRLMLEDRAREAAASLLRAGRVEDYNRVLNAWFAWAERTLGW